MRKFAPKMTTKHYTDSASAYIDDMFEGINRTFTDVEVISMSETNVVLKAKRYGRWWLLKGLQKSVFNDPLYQQRLRKEFEVLIQLQHSGIIAAFSLEEIVDYGLCIVMEYIEGMTLYDWLQTKHPYNVRRRLAHDVVSAVSYIHSKGIAHRDIKPQNIIVTHNGNNIKLIDFGLSDTDSYAVLKQPAGTVGYMSPEQWQSPIADIRNDIYSLGVVLQQMNAGYNAIVRKCLRQADARYQDTTELLYDMRRHDRRKARLYSSVAIALVAALLGMLWIQTQRLKTAAQQVAALQTQQNTRRNNIDDAIAEGKKIITNAMSRLCVEYHLDTLSRFEYLDMDILHRVDTLAEINKNYIEQIKENFTTQELDEIANTMAFFVGSMQLKVVEKYNKKKEAYDNAIMQRY